MIATTCKHETTKKNGRNKCGNQRLKCLDCGRSWVVDRIKPIGELRIPMDKAVLALNLIVEGMSVRAASRISGVHKNTIGDLILAVGANCEGQLRMQMRRFTRLTNGFSKTPEHHAAMQHLFFAHYNFCRKHETLKGATPAMAAGLTYSVWTIEELLTEAAK